MLDTGCRQLIHGNDLDMRRHQLSQILPHRPVLSRTYRFFSQATLKLYLIQTQNFFQRPKGLLQQLHGIDI